MNNKRLWTKEEEHILAETIRNEKTTKEKAYKKASVILKKRGYNRTAKACYMRYNLYILPITKVVKDDFNDKIKKYKELCEASIKSTDTFLRDIKALQNFIDTIK